LRNVAQGVADFARKRGLWCLLLAQQNQDGKLFGGNGLRKACDQLWFLETPEHNELPPRRWLRMDASRYTPTENVGNADFGGLVLNMKSGPYFEELHG
jgi:predicted ATP-dependent serine protease